MTAEADNRNQGGRRSILGFYYQFLATVGIASLGSRRLSMNNETTNLLAKFTADAQVILQPEQFGQDIVLKAASHYLLIQAKHSEYPLTNPFGLDDLRDVLIGFAYSWLQATREGVSAKAISGCFLLTNRPPGGALNQICDLAEQCRGAIKVPNRQLGDLPPTSADYADKTVDLKGAIRHSGSIRSLIDGWMKNFKGVEGKGWDDLSEGQQKERTQEAEKLTDAGLLILPRFYSLTNQHPEYFRTFFDRFCQEHGADEVETIDYGRRLTGELLAATTNEYELDLGKFREVVTGSRNALPLTLPSLTAACEQGWSDWVAAQGARQPWAIPRTLVGLEDALSDSQRVVVFVGGGGCGKTEVLAQVTEARIEELKLNSRAGLVLIGWSPRLQENWIGFTLGKWSKRGPVDHPFSRLRRANSGNGQGVLLWIAIDGADEKLPPMGLMNDLLNEARAGDIRLLLTCRNREYDRLIRNLLMENATASLGHESAPCRRVEVDEFSPEERSQVIAGSLDTDPSVWSAVEEQVAPATGVFPASTANLDLVRSFSHPRMMGVLIEVAQRNKSIPDQVLEGEVGALNEISSLFLKRFFKKHEDRAAKPESYAAAYALKAVAKATIDRLGPLDRVTDWIGTARQQGGLADATAHRLFDEADSGGLIELPNRQSSSREWIWRHDFVARYLADADPGDYLQ